MPDSDTILLLHMDGGDTSTTFTDDSANNFTISVNGGAQQDNAQYKFTSGTSLVLDGSGDFITAPDSAVWDLGTGDMTIDYWMYYTGPNGAIDIWSMGGCYGGTNKGVGIEFNAVSGGATLIFVNGGYTVLGVNVVRDQWTHCALVRSSGVFKYYADGTAIGSPWSNASDISGSTEGVSIGRWNPATNGDFTGWIDEFRISKVARWTSDFTAPTAPYNGAAPSVGMMSPNTGHWGGI
jgi:hypothetical protein